MSSGADEISARKRRSIFVHALVHACFTLRYSVRKRCGAPDRRVVSQYLAVTVIMVSSSSRSPSASARASISFLVMAPPLASSLSFSFMSHASRLYRGAANFSSLRGKREDKAEPSLW